MSNKPPIAWLIQFLILLIWGLSWFIWPESMLHLIADETSDPRNLISPVCPACVVPSVASIDPVSRPAIDQLRMSSPYLIGLAGFTVFAMMTRRTAVRRWIATVFALVFGLWAFVNYCGIWAGHYDLLTALPLSLVPVFLAYSNYSIARAYDPNKRAAEDAGDSSSKPARAFVLWLLQALVLIPGAVAFVIAPEFVLHSISAADPQALTPLAIHQTRLLGAISLGMGGMTILAMLIAASFAWRGFAFFFVGFFAVWTVSILWILVAGDYTKHVLWVLVPGLLFGPLNFLAFGLEGEFDPGDVSRKSDAWTPLDLWAGPLMALSVLLTRRRSSHLLGVAASGTFRRTQVARPTAGTKAKATTKATTKAKKAASTKSRAKAKAKAGAKGAAKTTAKATTKSTAKRAARKKAGAKSRAAVPALPAVPANEFFDAQEERGIVVRFANLTQLDDAALDVRGCGIKFSPAENESPFDLLLNTGSFCPAHSIVSFSFFVLSKFLPTKLVRAGTLRNAIAREGGIAGLRRAPESYSDLKFYGQLIRYWCEPDGRRWLVRYRCVPADDQTESGIPSAEDAAAVWLRERLPSETRPRDYLRDEIVERLRADGASLTLALEAQFHERRQGDSEEWFNPTVDWDREACPWMRIGELELDTVLSNEDAEELEFAPAHHPDSLGIPSSTGPFGYRSMGASEARVVRSLQRLRRWMVARSGPPEFGPVTEG